MINIDSELSASEVAEMKRDWQLEDAAKGFEWGLHHLRIDHFELVQKINEEFMAEMVVLNLPKLIKVAHGMVLFA